MFTIDGVLIVVNISVDSMNLLCSKARIEGVKLFSAKVAATLIRHVD